MRPRHAGVQYDVVTQLFFLGLEKTTGVDLEGGGELDLVSRGISKAFTALLAKRESVQMEWRRLSREISKAVTHARCRHALPTSSQPA